MYCSYQQDLKTECLKSLLMFVISGVYFSGECVVPSLVLLLPHMGRTGPVLVQEILPKPF